MAFTTTVWPQFRRAVVGSLTCTHNSKNCYYYYCISCIFPIHIFRFIVSHGIPRIKAAGALCFTNTGFVAFIRALVPFVRYINLCGKFYFLLLCLFYSVFLSRCAHQELQFSGDLRLSITVYFYCLMNECVIRARHRLAQINNFNNSIKCTCVPLTMGESYVHCTGYSAFYYNV